MTFGNLIQKARISAGLSQKELATKLGVSASMIGQYENNIRHPKLTTIQKIADALQIDVVNLFPQDIVKLLGISTSDHVFIGTDQNIYSIPLIANHSTLEQILLSAFSALNEEGMQKAVDRVIELTEIPRYKKHPPQD